MPTQAHSQAMVVLVLGILGFFTWGITGLVAGILGGRVIHEIDAQPGRYSNRSQASLGRGLGWASAALFALITFFSLLAY